MITLLPNEINPIFGTDTKKIRMNCTNNIRWLYIDLYDCKRVRNVKDFAILCGMSQSTVESWLRRDVIPKPQRRKTIERIFNLAEGSLINSLRPEVQDWSLEYYKRNGAKPTLRTYNIKEESVQAVAEPNAEYAENAESVLRKLCHELLNYEYILSKNKVIREIMAAWKILVVMLFFSCEAVELEETATGAETKPSHENTDTCFAWNGHIAVNCENLDNGFNDLLLLSLHEWQELQSANAPEGGKILQEFCESYQEAGLSGWQMPNGAEAKLLHDTYVDGSRLLMSLDSLLMAMNAMEMSVTEGSGNVRYLCDEGLKSFSLATGTKISNTGAKSRNYRMRLVKHVTVGQDYNPPTDEKVQEQLDDYLIHY